MSNAEILKQIEYYLSDKNLQSDEFFHEHISNSQDGFIPLNLFLKCNKIKKLNVVDEAKIIEAVKLSKVLELNDKNNCIRRKNNQALPDFTGVRKKVKPNEQGKEEEQKQQENPYDHFDPLIFTIKGTQPFKFTQISEALMRQYNISSPYVRYSKTEGNFALSKKRTPKENIERLEKEGLLIGEEKLSINVAEGQELAQFWQHHKRHFDSIIKRAKEQFSGTGVVASNEGIQTRASKKEQFQKKKAGEIKFHNQKYRDINQLKGIFKTILARSENDIPLKEPYHSMLLELLNYHDKKDSKKINLKHFTVGTHPEHPETRCFFIVKEDGSKEDFSCVKCIKNLEDSLKQ